MPSDCFIFFDNLDCVFYSGTNVNGRFELTTNSSKIIRGIVVRITGVANVCWEKNETIRENNQNVVKVIEYTNHEKYVDYENYVLGARNASLFELSPGRYTYSFECPLPLNIPSSFTGKYGEIIYEVDIEIDRANLSYSNKFKQAFTVINSLDLNLNPTYRQPKIEHGQTLYDCCSCFCGRGNVEVEFNLSHIGYTAGQDIPFSIIITNDTDSDLDEGSKVELKKKIMFQSKIPEVEVKTREIDIDTKLIGGVLRLSKKEFKNHLEIPSTPPTTVSELSCCIRIEYFIKVMIITGCCADNIILYVNIVIGAKPLIIDGSNDVITMQPNSLNVPQNWENNAFGSLRNLDLPPGYHTIGPPSYEDAKKLLEDFEKRTTVMHRHIGFTPRYPVYSIREPTAPYPENM